MEYLKKLSGQTAIYGLSSVVPRLLNYILFPLHTRVFGGEEYGIITEMYAYLAFLLILLTYGMETGFFRFATKESNTNETYSTAFFSLLTTSIIFVATIALFSNNIVSFLGYASNPEYVIYLGFVIGIDAFIAIPFAKLRLENRAFTFALIKIIGVSVNVFFNFFFFVICKYIHIPFIGTDLGIEYVFISNLIASVCTLFILIFFTKGLAPTSFSFSILRLLLIYSFPLLISGLGGTANEWLDRIFIKYLIPDEQNPLLQLGIYGANLKLAVLMILFIQMFRYAAEPFFFSQSDNKDKSEIYSNILKYFLVFTLLIFLSVGLFTDIFQFLVGPNFREGLHVVPILLLANLFNGIYFNLSIWYKLTNRTWFGIYYTFAGAAVTITLYFILIPLIGYYGAAVARLVCYVFMTILCFYGSKKYFGISYDVKRMLMYLSLAIILFIIGYFVHINILLVSLLFRIFLILFFIFIVVKTEKINLSNLYNSLRNDS